MGKIRNQGSASLEATLVMSVFLLAMVSLFWMAQSVLAEAQVYEAAAETAEYMAEIILGQQIRRLHICGFQSMQMKKKQWNGM